MRKYGIVVIVVIVCTLIFNAAASAEETDFFAGLRELVKDPEGYMKKMQYQPLEGIKEVDILIEKLDADAIEDGLKEETIKTAVELTLRSSGIKIISGTRANFKLTDPPADNATLYVNINSMKLSNGTSYTYAISVECKDKVKLQRSPYNECQAITWDKGIIGIAPVSSMPQKIKDAVKELTEEFSNDFLSANPKK